MKKHRFAVTRKKATLVLAAGVSVALALTGCSGGTATSGSAGSGGAKTTISVWHAYTAGASTEAQKIVDAYNKSQDKYVVKLQFDGGGDQFTSKLLNGIKDGQAPQLVLDDGLPQGLGQVVKTGAVVPLDSRLAASDSSITKANLTPGLLSTGTFNGKVYSIPTDVGDFAVIYNKQMFTDAGITSPPKTWTEFEADAKKLTHGSSQYGAYLPVGGAEWQAFTWESMLWGAGGNFLNKANTAAEFDSAAGVKALTAWTEMVKDGTAYPQSLATPSDSNGTGALTSKKVAMEINGAYNLGTVGTALGASNVGTFALPGVTTPGMNLGTDNSFILKGTSAQEAGAWNFLEYWMRPSVEAKWDVATGFFPANSETNSNATWTNYLRKNPNVKPFVDELAYAKARPSIAQYDQVSTALSTQLEKAMLLQESPAEALAAAAASANSALK